MGSVMPSTPGAYEPMIRRLWRGMLTGLVAVLMLLGVAGCSGLSSGPSQDLIAQAVAVQARENQASLWQQLSLQAEDTPSLAVSRVQVLQSRPVQVASTLAYEVTGTYQYRICYPHHRPIKQSDVPFDVVLQAIPETEDWQLLQIESDRSWAWEPLVGDQG